MSGMDFGDRIRTIVVTATLTSAVWIVAGSGAIEGFGGGLASLRRTAPATAAAASGGPGTSSRSDTAAAQPVYSSGDYVIPVAGVRPEQLTDTFSDARSGGRVHEAIDIMAPRGTAVLAATAGKVEKLFQSALGGNTIYVRSPDRRTITYYAHLDRYASGLAEGQQVRRGQQIGFVGSTGDASADGPHLHFEIMQTTPESGWWEHVRSINPYPILSGRGG